MKRARGIVLFAVVCAALSFAGVGRSDPGALNVPDAPPPTISDVASLAAGHSVRVECWTPVQLGGHGGWVPDGEYTVAYVSTLACADVQLLIDRPDGDRGYGDAEEALGLFVVAHEAQHLAGTVDEHAADCGALASFPRLLAFLQIPWTRWATLEGIAQRIHDGNPAPYAGACS